MDDGLHIPTLKEASSKSGGLAAVEEISSTEFQIVSQDLQNQRMSCKPKREDRCIVRGLVIDWVGDRGFAPRQEIASDLSQFLLDWCTMRIIVGPDHAPVMTTVTLAKLAIEGTELWVLGPSIGNKLNARLASNWGLAPATGTRSEENFFVGLAVTFSNTGSALWKLKAYRVARNCGERRWVPIDTVAPDPRVWRSFQGAVGEPIYVSTGGRLKSEMHRLPQGWRSGACPDGKRRKGRKGRGVRNAQERQGATRVDRSSFPRTHGEPPPHAKGIYKTFHGEINGQKKRNYMTQILFLGNSFRKDCKSTAEYERRFLIRQAACCSSETPARLARDASKCRLYRRAVGGDFARSERDPPAAVARIFARRELFDSSSLGKARGRASSPWMRKSSIRCTRGEICEGARSRPPEKRKARGKGFGRDFGESESLLVTMNRKREHELPNQAIRGMTCRGGSDFWTIAFRVIVDGQCDGEMGAREKMSEVGGGSDDARQNGEA
ncbi:hypothetical protein M407DRAFT_228031 [Tulasnella calospora MUT 4182]|uniref:Uncharacterized protein n=1 Tax=Tulasnella calospora MUT 4182 TaxID=1051891 RepID=A0A0C3M6M8_9AGAM|nr:hypothetical protein M407DRAFT_228031 [Tulasnella calospora MUT 4182]